MSTELSLLEALFLDRASEFEQQWTMPERHVIAHGSRDRFPESMHSGDMSSFERLCQAYQGVMYMAGGEGDDYRMIRIQGPPPADVVRMGLTTQFFNLFPSIPGARPVRARLAEELGVAPSAVRISAWISPHSKGIEPHYDETDTIIVQLAGEKAYRIGPNASMRDPMRAWSRRQPFDLLDAVAFEDGMAPKGYPADLEEVVLKPGSVLFLPRGYWHATKASGESYSLSIRLDPPIGMDTLLRQLGYFLARDPAWRRPLHGAWGKPEARNAARMFMQDLVTRLGETLPRLSADAILASAADEPDLAFLYVTPETPMLRPWTKAFSVETKPAVCSVSIRDSFAGVTEKLDFPPTCGPTLEWLARVDGYFRVRDVENRSDLPADAVRRILRELVSKGAIRLVPGATELHEPSAP